MSNKKRTSPTVSITALDIYDSYGIRISDFLEREALSIVIDDDRKKEVLGNEKTLIKKEIEFYKQQKQIINKRIYKLERKLEKLDSNLNEVLKERVAKNIKSARDEIDKILIKESHKLYEANKDGYRYNINKLKMDKIEIICNKYDVSPKMVLPLVNKDYIEFLDKKSQKYIK